MPGFVGVWRGPSQVAGAAVRPPSMATGAQPAPSVRDVVWLSVSFFREQEISIGQLVLRGGGVKGRGAKGGGGGGGLAAVCAGDQRTSTCKRAIACAAPSTWG